jgi:hypothetical protein
VEAEAGAGDPGYRKDSHPGRWAGKNNKKGEAIMPIISLISPAQLCPLTMWHAPMKSHLSELR